MHQEHILWNKVYFIKWKFKYLVGASFPLLVICYDLEQNCFKMTSLEKTSVLWHAYDVIMTFTMAFA